MSTVRTSSTTKHHNTTMRLHYAAKALPILITASLASARTRQHKSGKGEDDGLLDYYQFPSSANFTGEYQLCFFSNIINFRGEPGEVNHVCRREGEGERIRRLALQGVFQGQSLVTIQINPIDGFNAYQLEKNVTEESLFDPLIHANAFQGFAEGNHLEMQSFGVDEGTGAAGEELLRLPARMNCRLYTKGVLSCTSMTQEYCDSGSGESGACEGGEGEWLTSHSTYSVSAKDLSDCPAPPDGFCSDTPIDPFPCFNGLRRLQELSKHSTTASFDGDDGHRRLMTEHEAGVNTQVDSKDSDRLEWIMNHVAAQKERMDGGGEIEWDPLIEHYFKNVHSKNIAIECNSSEEGSSLLCTSSAKTQCGKELIRDHADYHEEIAKAIQEKDGDHVFAPRDVPDSCIETAAP